MPISEEDLMAKIKTLNDTLWDSKVNDGLVQSWLDNFEPEKSGFAKRKLHALFLLSNFIYVGVREMRELMKSMFEDLYKRPITNSIRKANNNTLDANTINPLFFKELKNTRFLGMGNPSESGYHLLYYFRQENGLPKSLFIQTHEIFNTSATSSRHFSDKRSITFSESLRHKDVTRYVFIDDFCGTGNQGVQYSKDIVSRIKNIDPGIQVLYYVVAATKDGLNKIRRSSKFDEAKCIIELDSSFQLFNHNSRYFTTDTVPIQQDFARAMCLSYGNLILPGNALGYGNCQLLIGFAHNTPDNTLPIIWSDCSQPPWNPIFRRYPKLYGF